MSDAGHKALIAISVEVVLMRKGGPQYQLVLARLERDHGCKIFDCFDHPEALRAVLKDVYGKDYQNIIDSIEFELSEAINEKDVAVFLAALKQ